MNEVINKMNKMNEVMNKLLTADKFMANIVFKTACITYSICEPFT